MFHRHIGIGRKLEVPAMKACVQSVVKKYCDSALLCAYMQ